MKKTATALITALLLSLLAGRLLVQNEEKTFIVRGETSDANTIVDGNTNANVTIQSPENKTYNSNNITLAFTIESDAGPREYFSGRVLDLFLTHGCVLDNDLSRLVQAVKGGYFYEDFPDDFSVTLSESGNRYFGNTTLANLPEGPHNLTVWIRADQYMISYKGYIWSVYSTVSFNIDSPPYITVLSPQTKTYNTSFIPLDFTVSEKSSKIEYSLDGRKNVTIGGNTTLAWLASGDHNLTVFAVDETGNAGASETLFFTVNAPEVFPGTLVAAIVIVVAVVLVGTGLLLVRKRRKEATHS